MSSVVVEGEDGVLRSVVLELACVDGEKRQGVDQLASHNLHLLPHLRTFLQTKPTPLEP